jgi:hypothetical protein
LWGASEFPQRKKKEAKKKENVRKGRPDETAAAEEIEVGCLRRLLVDDFHKLLG